VMEWITEALEAGSRTVPVAAARDAGAAAGPRPAVGNHFTASARRDGWRVTAFDVLQSVEPYGSW